MPQWAMLRTIAALGWSWLMLAPPHPIDAALGKPYTAEHIAKQGAGAKAPTSAAPEIPIKQAVSEPIPSRAIKAAALSPDGKDLIVATAGGRLLRFDLGEMFSTEFPFTPQDLVVHTACGINNLLFSPKGDSLAAVEEGATGPSRIFLFDAADRNFYLNQIVHGAEDYADLQFSADGRRIAFASYNRIQISEVASGRTIWTKVADPGELTFRWALVHGADGRYAWMNIGTDKAPRWQLWDLTQRKPARNTNLSRFPPEGSNFYGGENSPRIFRYSGRFYAVTRGRLADIEHGTAFTGLPRNSEGKTSPDGRWFGVRSNDKKALDVYSLFPVKRARHLATSRPAVSQYWAFMGSHAVANTNDSVEIWDLNTGKVAVTLFPDLGWLQDQDGIVTKWLAVTPSGEWFGSGVPGDVAGLKAPKNDPAAVEKAFRAALRPH